MELEEECIFIAKSDSVKFTTQTNGDIIIISGLSFTKEQAASLAWLVNHQNRNVIFEARLQV